MSRRRQKNNLLPKMIGVAVVVNAILLPILSKLGVFKAVKGNRYTEVKLVNLPPPEKKPRPPKPPPPKKQTAKAHPHPPGHTARQASHAPPSNQPRVHVVMGQPGGNGAGNGTGDAGIVPSGTPLPPPPPANPPPPPTPPVEQPKPPTPPTPPVEPPKPVEPVKPVEPPKPPPPPPHQPVVTEAVPLDKPQPTLPDDLTYDDIHGDFRALFTIHADGSTSVKMLSGTGNGRLDQLAMDAAKRWKFRPATVDGKPVDSFTRLAIQFYSA